MKTPAVAAVVFAILAAAPLVSAQRPVSAPPSSAPPAASSIATPETQQEKDELRARIFMATKRYQEAADLWEKLAKQHSHDPHYPNAAGIAYVQLGDLDKARKFFDRATRIDKRFAEAFNNLGATWYSQKNYKKALDYYRRAVDLQPGLAGFHANVGYALFSLNRPQEAEIAFRRALLMDPTIFQQNDRNGTVAQNRAVSDNGLFAFTMAKTYAETGDAAHCAAYLRRALDEGYKDLSKVQTDPSFAGVLADPNVRSVLDMVPPGDTPAAPPGA
jgi:Tfp pilus assembly protein PilF